MAESRTDRFAAERAALVRALRREVRDERVLEAIAAVPRERFVPPELSARAYDNAPVGIGYGQTISQPLVVAIMLEALDLRGGERVLDVGTGSGYQAALLSHLADEVVSVERIPELAARAGAVLAELYCRNVEVQLAGQAMGWPLRAPYDAIVVGAAAPAVPEGLLSQLAEGGRLVIPVGDRDEQRLTLVRHTAEGMVRGDRGPCRFVPLLGAEGFAAPQNVN